MTPSERIRWFPIISFSYRETGSRKIIAPRFINAAHIQLSPHHLAFCSLSDCSLPSLLPYPSLPLLLSIFLSLFLFSLSRSVSLSFFLYVSVARSVVLSLSHSSLQCVYIHSCPNCLSRSVSMCLYVSCFLHVTVALPF